MDDFRVSRKLYLLISLSPQADDSISRFESPGTKHKELTFSEYLGKSYETDVSEKFIEYLKLCFR